MTTLPRGRLIVAVGAILMVGACRSGDPVAPTNAMDDFFSRLPGCAIPTDGQPHDLPLPDEVILTTLGTSKIISASGFAPGAPGAVAAAIATQPDVEVVWSEDEGFEAEVLIEAHGRRTLVKALAVCDGGSSVDIVSTATGR